ncbi:MAG: 3-dehydroquinate synthase family protein, partial [Selenomonas sp.]
IKYGIIFDADFFAALDDHAVDALRLSHDAALFMVERSCEIKAEVVAKDEKEGGLRRILNYGHTIAHAIEKETGYARYNHGEAVAIGSLGAAYISEALGMIDDADVLRVRRLTERLGLPLFAEDCTVEGLYAAIFHDKKTVDGKVNWVLMEGIGKVCVRDDVPESIVRTAMARCLRI